MIDTCLGGTPAIGDHGSDAVACRVSGFVDCGQLAENRENSPLSWVFAVSTVRGVAVGAGASLMSAWSDGYTSWTLLRRITSRRSAVHS